jgi:hypothetical protein
VQPTVPVRLATWAIALVVGAVYGVAGTVSQASMIGWFPLGLVLSVIGAAALLVAVRALTVDRWSALATGLGMFAAVIAFSGKGPGGSVIVPAPAEGEIITPGVIWTWAVPILVAIVVAWPSRRVVVADAN